MSDNYDDMNDITEDDFEHVCSMCRRTESKAETPIGKRK